MSSPLTRRSAWQVLALCVVACLWICPSLAWAAAPELVFDPPQISFSSDRETRDATLRIHNPGAQPVTIDRIVVRGSDWGGFAITDEQYPHSVPASSSVDVHLRADPRAFETGRDEHDDPSYRRGRAKLVVTHGETTQVPLEFTPHASSQLPFRLALLALWTVLVFASTRDGEELPAERAGRVLLLAAVLTALCALPLAGAWCAGDPSLAFGELARARCRAGLGGAAVSALTPTYSAWWLLAGTATFVAYTLRLDGQRTRIELFSLLAATLFACSYQTGDWDLASWNYEAFTPHPGMAFAFLISYARLQSGRASRLDALVWSAVFAGVFLAGPSLGPMQALVESSTVHVGLGIGVFGLKLALTQRVGAQLAGAARLERLSPIAVLAAAADLAWTLVA